MKQLILVPALLCGINSFSQELIEENEIYRMAELKKQCIERSKCNVKVFPNPSRGPVHVEGPDGAVCQVHSSIGTYVGTWTLNENGLDLNDLPAGNYIVSVGYNQIIRVNRIVIL